MPYPGRHLVFYDGECGLCDHAVQFILKIDKKKIFVFAPLQGKTAAELLKELSDTVKQADSLILLEDYQSTERKISIYGRGAFRILWLLGGFWRLVGFLCFLPPILYNWGYYLIAKNRHFFFRNSVCKLPTQEEKERFLP